MILASGEQFGGEGLLGETAPHAVYAQSDCILFELNMNALLAVAANKPALLDIVKQVLLSLWL